MLEFAYLKTSELLCGSLCSKIARISNASKVVEGVSAAVFESLVWFHRLMYLG